MKTYEEFIKEVGITMEAREGGRVPEDFKDSDPWVIKLTCKGYTYELDYYTGIGLRKFNPFKYRHVFHHAPYNKEDVYKAMHNRSAEAVRSISDAVPPTIEDVLDTLALDASSYDNARDFAGWAADFFGYDSDSIKAEKTYKAVGEESRRLLQLLGHELYNELINDVERL